MCKKFSIDTIVRITADNPLIDPKIVNNAIEEYCHSNCDYLTNSIDRTFPNGTEVEIFSFNALEIAWKNAKKKSEREHVTPYFYNNPKKFKIHYFKQQKVEAGDRKENLDELQQRIDTMIEFIKTRKEKHIAILNLISIKYMLR